MFEIWMLEIKLLDLKLNNLYGKKYIFKINLKEI